jgi:ubiquinone/menaquinone biosynthesis C-methylase UbiE
MTPNPQELLTEVKEIYSKQTSESGLGIYSDPDWNRILKAFNYVDGSTVLDVGIGNGALVNMLHKSNNFNRVVGIDIKRNNFQELLDGIDFNIMNVLDLKFSDNEFDTVICMEVLEHLEIKDFYTGLSELRRVAKDLLIVTVPYEEKEPVWWYDRPGGHRQSFNLKKLNAIFPLGKGQIIDRPGGTNWIMIIEERQSLDYYRTSSLIKS